jgi:3-hydroxyacyl-[acyl-carrier-protein] dehydratase
MSETVQTSPDTAATVLDINQIQGILPHRYPFLLLDRVIEVQPRQRIVALKNVTINEPFFQGHFPGYPLMPGVLMVEAMAQTGGVLLLLDLPVAERGDKLIVFTGIEKAKFRKPVTPGDQLRIDVSVIAFRRGAGRMEGKIYVGEKLVAEAILSCFVISRGTPKTNDGAQG